MDQAEPTHPPKGIRHDPSPSATAKRASLREMATDAIRYWEPRRLHYNAVLAVIVVGYFFASWPASLRVFTFDSVLFLFILAVLANGCYCAAYIPDLFAQYTGFRPLWLRWRGLLLALGIVFAAIITRFFCIAFFAVTTPAPIQ
jgi:hypothetical protein